MPTSDQLPANVVAWHLESRRTVLLIHDMQKYFLRPFPMDREPGGELLTNAARLRDACEGLGVPVCYTMQPGSMTPVERGLLMDFWGPGMTVNPDDRAVVEPLAPAPGDWLLTKWRYSAFHRTDLLARMRESGRDQLLICGVYAHCGVLMSACDAFSHDVQPFLAANAIGDFSLDYHQLALRYAAERCGVVGTVDQLLAQLGRDA
jgi:isochorismate hydrolase